MLSLGFDIAVKDSQYCIENIINYYNVWNEEKVFIELKKIADQLGKFPTRKELSQIGQGGFGLVGAMNKYGGSNHFATKMGLTCRKPIGYWTDERINHELSQLADKLNRFPRSQENPHLYNAICDHGGMQKFRSQWLSLHFS